jgi:hypothetical protein
MGNNSSNINLKFKIIVDKNEAQVLLDNAEKVDMYVEECSDDPSNSKARRNNNYSANSMTSKEYNFFEVVLENAKDKLSTRLKMDLEEVNLIQLMPSADGGMPHTRPSNLICYPDITRFFNVSTLIHELWHIHQRKYETLWSYVFKSWGWEPWVYDIPDRFEKYRRLNPDTIDTPFWIFRESWIPIPIFKDISNPKVDEVEIWFYNPSKQYHTRQIPNEFVSEYPNVPLSAYEHPRELAAYMLSEPDNYSSSPGFIKLLDLIGHTSILITT